MAKSNDISVTDVDSMKYALREYQSLHMQVAEHAKRTKPLARRIGQYKKALLKHMVSENLKKVQLPNKDLLVLNETIKKPVLSEKYLKTRLASFYNNDEAKADEVFLFLQTVPETDLQTRVALKHLEADSYIENESEMGDDGDPSF